MTKQGPSPTKQPNKAAVSSSTLRKGVIQHSSHRHVRKVGLTPSPKVQVQIVSKPLNKQSLPSGLPQGAILDQVPGLQPLNIYSRKLHVQPQSGGGYTTALSGSKEVIIWKHCHLRSSITLNIPRHVTLVSIKGPTPPQQQQQRSVKIHWSVEPPQLLRHIQQQIHVSMSKLPGQAPHTSKPSSSSNRRSLRLG